MSIQMKLNLLFQIHFLNKGNIKTSQKLVVIVIRVTQVSKNAFCNFSAQYSVWMAFSAIRYVKQILNI